MSIIVALGLGGGTNEPLPAPLPEPHVQTVPSKMGCVSGGQVVALHTLARERAKKRLEVLVLFVSIGITQTVAAHA